MICESITDVQDNSSEYITTGEKIIYYDPNSKSPQTGEVACILKYTPCAIVKFVSHHIYIMGL